MAVTLVYTCHIYYFHVLLIIKSVIRGLSPMLIKSGGWVGGEGWIGSKIAFEAFAVGQRQKKPWLLELRQSSTASLFTTVLGLVEVRP
jgi:hypothetical protein